MWGQLRKRKERGQTFVEFALALPVLIVLLFGIIQFGIAFHSYITLTDATRAGARKAAVSRLVPAAERTSAVTQAVRDSAQNLDQSQLTPSVSSTWVRGGEVTVSATYPYEIKLFGIPVKNGLLTSTTKERVE
ncbi:MAG TPA: TadE/TadG family type IV pilus assembly protein [Gaiellaceae bacterium]|jgi:Flp pilus assembly protein TadG|nr:TadE/TadG family type IV pilus assembly protein [Gaiellaceae bacterium]